MLPILKATCIKFVYMFRNQLPNEHLQNFMSLLSNFLKCDAKVTQTYAAATIEKLVLKKENGKVILTNENID